MRAHYLQHVPFEGLGSIENWLHRAGHRITGTEFFRPFVLPKVDVIDLLVVMGGPMGVDDEAAFPWLAPEKAFIREAVESGKPVLGICLGAQLIARSMGAAVHANPEKEIGWFPIQGVEPNEVGLFGFPASLEVFHWHGDTFEMPSGATLLARSEGCRHQAFQLGDSVIGLQFHLETTADSARQIVANCRDELIPARYVQTESQILSATSERYASINRLMGDVLTYLQQRTGRSKGL
jgi:GMP synthase-like glutamine amidotransferase